MNNRSRARLLLVELILDLVIFALCAAVCVALLVRARSMSRESTELTQAVYLAQTAAETWRSHGDGADRTVDGYQVRHTRTGGGPPSKPDGSAYPGTAASSMNWR